MVTWHNGWPRWAAISSARGRLAVPERRSILLRAKEMSAIGTLQTSHRAAARQGGRRGPGAGPPPPAWGAPAAAPQEQRQHQPQPAPPPSQQPEVAAIKALSWRSIGPANMGGRVTAVAGVPGDRDTFYVAGAGGGGVKRTNAGGTVEGPV